MFQKLEGDTVLLRQGGVFKPSELYTFQDGIYARLGSGYVRLRADGTTSKDGIYFTHIEYDGPLFQDKFGRLSIKNQPKSKKLSIEVNETGTSLKVAA